VRRDVRSVRASALLGHLFSKELIKSFAEYTLDLRYPDLQLPWRPRIRSVLERGRRDLWSAERLVWEQRDGRSWQAFAHDFFRNYPQQGAALKKTLLGAFATEEKENLTGLQ